MDTAVPRDIDVPGQLAAVPRAHPAQTVPLQLSAPIVLNTLVAEAFRVQRRDLGVGKWPASLVGDHRDTVSTPQPRAHVIFQRLKAGTRAAIGQSPPSGATV